MSIAPPSDIVLDVAQAADPVRLQAATAKLARLAAGGTADFGEILQQTPAAKPATTSAVARPVLVPDDRPTHINTDSISPYQKFEALVLQNFVETILPKDTELFGDSASADACRSMLADQIATQLAKTGKLGIARTIEKAHAGTAASVGPLAENSVQSLALRGLHLSGASSVKMPPIQLKRMS